MPRLTVAERLAATIRDTTLAEIIARATMWDYRVVQQAVYLVGLDRREFSANALRDVLPELAHGHLGAALGGMHKAGITEHTGQWVPSTSGPTKGHRIAVWTLTALGRHLAEHSAATTLEAA